MLRRAVCRLLREFRFRGGLWFRNRDAWHRYRLGRARDSADGKCRMMHGDLNRLRFRSVVRRGRRQLVVEALADRVAFVNFRVTICR